MIPALQHYGPALPVEDLVQELNRLYHEHEAAGYEATHPEIFEQLPPVWSEMIRQSGLLAGPGTPLRILDFGCGTGFEARQCLEKFGAQAAAIACYDPSPRMLDRCRESLVSWGSRAEFFSDLRLLDGRKGEFNALATNSVLHHLVDPVRSIRQIEPLLAPDAIWLCGHEPSRRYLENRECRAALGAYRKRDRWRRLISPRRAGRKLLRWAGAMELPEDYASRLSFENAMFEKRLPPGLVSSLVDFHVVVDAAELGQARGMDFRQLQAALSGSWELCWRRTYAFLGPYYEAGLSPKWKGEARRLCAAYPDDGANCSLIWRRQSSHQA